MLVRQDSVTGPAPDCVLVLWHSDDEKPCVNHPANYSLSFARLCLLRPGSSTWRGYHHWGKTLDSRWIAAGALLSTSSRGLKAPKMSST